MNIHLNISIANPYLHRLPYHFAHYWNRSIEDITPVSSSALQRRWERQRLQSIGSDWYYSNIGCDIFPFKKKCGQNTHTHSLSLSLLLIKIVKKEIFSCCISFLKLRSDQTQARNHRFATVVNSCRGDGSCRHLCGTRQLRQERCTSNYLLFFFFKRGHEENGCSKCSAATILFCVCVCVVSLDFNWTHFFVDV